MNRIRGNHCFNFYFLTIAHTHNKVFCFLTRLHPPMIAVGSDDANQSAGGKVQIYEYSDIVR